MKTNHRKGGVVGTTVTWFSATILIFIMMILFIFASTIFLAGKIDKDDFDEGVLYHYNDLITRQTLLKSIDYLMGLEELETLKLNEGASIFLSIYEKLSFEKKLNFNPYKK